ncbi:MAG: hypothetical protein JWQ63_1879 [Mucilaginibacter sp.]|nr:hypothetical protein [Mucilaginibacter sp.]
MIVKIFKYTLLVLIPLLTSQVGFAQEINTSKQNVSQQNTNDIDINFKLNINDLVKNLVVKVNEIAPKIELGLKDYEKDLNFNVTSKIDLGLSDLKNLDLDNYINNSDEDFREGRVKQKFKSYSKSYPIDANDKIRLSNQYGRIIVNTWDRHEIKVDVQIKAEANDDDEAQKLLDGVQIRDSKEGDLVSFRTTIEPNENGSWKIWEWGGKKNRKLEINYTVYMPTKTDLTVEDSYGSIQLPNLDGRVKIRSSYGSVLAQNLSNPSNEIEGSYGSLKVGTLNGAHLDYSYGSVDMDECSNLKANLSYGSFKLGKLKGTADLDLSYVGGFKIEEMGSTFKRLNVNSSYSGVSLGVPGSNNFDFDITTNYGGFNYNDNKVTITSKTPPDGSKHVGPTRNYKGHFGKEGNEAQVNIHTTYGSVNIE